MNTQHVQHSGRSKVRGHLVGGYHSIKMIVGMRRILAGLDASGRGYQRPFIMIYGALLRSARSAEAHRARGRGAACTVVAMLLETKKVHVSPATSCRNGGIGCGGAAAARRSRAISCLVLLIATASTRAAPGAETADESEAATGAGQEFVVGFEKVLVPGQDNAGAGLSMLESLLASLESFLAENGLPSASLVCAAVAVSILFLLLLGRVGIGGGIDGRGSSKKRKGVVLFLGPCGSGKTAICYRLSHGGGATGGTVVPTVTSMEPCRYPCRLGSSSSAAAPVASLVDYPGHERLRAGVIAELRLADRVVFMLDGSCLAAQVAAGAELLYDVLTNPSLEGCRGLMLALSKSDIKEAKVSRAKILLQKELDKLRGTRGMLGTQGEEDDMPVAMALGRPGQPFSLEVDSPCEVVVAGCSVVKEGGLKSVEEFVRESLR